MTDDTTKTVTACMLIIGDEVLSGRTQDANLQYLATHLNDIGVRMAEARVIPDDPAVIVSSVNECRAKFDYVFTTGGIGPTHDDITSACIAEAFGVAIERNLDAKAMLLERIKEEDMNEARLKMTEIPVGATLIENPVSKAPGFQMENVYVMAGIPKIMQSMFDGLKGGLTGGATMLSVSMTAYLPEGQLARPVGDVQAAHGDVEIGSYPFVRDGGFGANLVIRSTNEDAMIAAREDLRERLRALGTEPVDEKT